MNDDMRKRLTEYLGEESKPDNEYHCYGTIRESGETNNCHCFTDGMRNFDCPDDMDALRRKLVEKGEWLEFHRFARDLFCGYYVTVCSRDQMEADFNAWLFNAENGCFLVAEWLKEKEGL